MTNPSLAKEFTGGPWQLRERFRNDDPFEIIGNIDGDADDEGRMRMICTEVCEVADNDDDEANARLISAAPELYGALKFIMAFYEPGQRHLDTEAWKVAEARARAALAKAVQ